MDYSCFTCSTTDKIIKFPSLGDLVAHEKGGHKTLPPPEINQVSPKETPIEEIKPPVLAYKWIGRCTKCGRELQTIIVELTEKQAIIAYCENCHAQRAEQKVIPIAKQKIKSVKEVV